MTVTATPETIDIGQITSAQGVRTPDHLASPGVGAESKDVVENRLHREVCAGTVTLTDAQHEIATDWTTAS